MGVYVNGNRWYIDYYVNGTRKREVVNITGKDPSTITRRDAEKALNIRKSELATGKFDIAKTLKPVKFEKLVMAYLDWANANHKTPERDQASCKNLLSYFKGKYINSINLWEIEKYKFERKKQGRQPETINKELGAIRRMFNLSIEGALSIKVGKNPVKGIKLLKVPKRKHRVYKDWEFLCLYESAPSHFKVILLCAYMTGMRRSEIINLKWKNVGLDCGYVHVVETKNGESRSIPINNALLKTLRDMKKISVNEFVFTTPQGKQYTSKTAWKSVWAMTLKKSGIEKGRFHDFRHTFCSNLIVDEKEDYITVMGLSGHKDIRMLKQYSHTHEDAKKSAIEKLGKHIKNSPLDTYMDTKDNE